EGSELASATINLWASPLFMNHHLQPAEDLWVVDTTQCFGSNAPFLAGYDAALGAERVKRISGPDYDCDRWYQDEPEYANALGDDGHRLKMVIDSIRDRGLDNVPEDQHYGPDYGIVTRGSQPKSTYDSFGNLEATPPVTVDGVDYPYGRIYYGRHNGTGLHSELAEFLAAQELQKPFEIDTTWLCVGHVDEWMSWVPDPSSPKGFKMIYGDIDLGYALLEDMPADTVLPRYEDHGYGTVEEILADANLRAYNEDIRDDYLLPIKQKFMEEAGLEESDFLAMPSLFERLGNCGGTGLALIPGMANLNVVNFGEGDNHLLIPDPFLRTDDNDLESDPVIEHVTAMMPDGLQVHYIDDWNSYHLQYGEVHCGTNIQRTPLVEDWWNAGAHLMEGN
ncbi:MAG: protein-arginine deiminase family protein, partial [Nannocystaceae bacterium]